jgi:hypothetical protein
LAAIKQSVWMVLEATWSEEGVGYMFLKGWLKNDKPDADGTKAYKLYHPLRIGPPMLSTNGFRLSSSPLAMLHGQSATFPSTGAHERNLHGLPGLQRQAADVGWLAAEPLVRAVLA